MLSRFHPVQFRTQFMLRPPVPTRGKHASDTDRVIGADGNQVAARQRGAASAQHHKHVRGGGVRLKPQLAKRRESDVQQRAGRRWDIARVVDDADGGALWSRAVREGRLQCRVSSATRKLFPQKVCRRHVSYSPLLRETWAAFQEAAAQQLLPLASSPAPLSCLLR
jgi:hypothetical protein